MAFVPDEEEKPKGRFVPDERRASPPKTTFDVPFRPKIFVSPLDQPARMTTQQFGVRSVPVEGPVDRAIFEAGGKATDALSKIGVSPEIAAGGGFLTNLGLQVGTTFLGGGAGAKAAPALEAGAKIAMQSALKPTLNNLRSGKAAKAIDTMLEGGFNATPGGVQAMKAEIAKLNDEIVSAISNSPATVDKNAVASRLMDSLKKFSMQVNPNSDVKAIEKAWTEFLDHPVLAGQRTMPVQTAQEMKQATYRALGEKSYGELKGAEVEAQKQLARGLKEEIAAAVPQIAGLNKKESELINALSIAERRALMDGNKNIGGLAWLSHNPSAWAAFMADKSALFKSLVARMLHSGSQAIPENVARTIAGTTAAVSGQAPRK